MPHTRSQFFHGDGVLRSPARGCQWEAGAGGKCNQDASIGTTNFTAPGSLYWHQCRCRPGAGCTVSPSCSCFKELLLAYCRSDDVYSSRRRSDLAFPTLDPQSDTEPTAAGCC